MKDIKDIITGVFNTALLINERAKFNFFSFFHQILLPLIFVEDQIEDLTVIPLSEFTCVTFKQF